MTLLDRTLGTQARCSLGEGCVMTTALCAPTRSCASSLTQALLIAEVALENWRRKAMISPLAVVKLNRSVETV